MATSDFKIVDFAELLMVTLDKFALGNIHQSNKVYFEQHLQSIMLWDRLNDHPWGPKEQRHNTLELIQQIMAEECQSNHSYKLNNQLFPTKTAANEQIIVALL